MVLSPRELGEQFILPIRDLLTQAQNLNYVATSGNILSIVIRVLWRSRQGGSYGALDPPAESARHLLRGSCLVNLDGGKIVVTGRESASVFVDLARRWYCVAPNLDEESFFDPMTPSTWITGHGSASNTGVLGRTLAPFSPAGFWSFGWGTFVTPQLVIYDLFSPCCRGTIRLIGLFPVLSQPYFIGFAPIGYLKKIVYQTNPGYVVACRSPNMDSYHTNPQLPFDVLGLVFSHYAEEENIQHPLETLLLVSRSWSHAALGHRALWSNLRILIGHEPTATIWNTRLPLRLARRAPNAPLDIMLRNLLDAPHEKSFDWFTGADPRMDEWCHSCGVEDVFSIFTFPCRCFYAARACVDSCLKLLAGEDGELCRQWRSFTLILGDLRREQQSSNQVKEALSYPAPILSSLVLRGLLFPTIADRGPRLFPDTCALKHLTLLDCDLSSLPDFGNTEKAEVGFTDSFHSYYIMSSFRLWTNLQRLSLWISAGVNIEVPSRLDDLRRLDLIIDWDEFPPGLLTCEMSCLTTLSLDFYEYGTLDKILLCQGIEWSKLKVLRLDTGHVYRERDRYPAVPHSLVELLTRARNLEYFYGSKDTMAAVFRILGSTNDGGSNTHAASEPYGTLLRGTRLVDPYDNSTIKISGRESAELLKKLSIRWGCA